MGRGDKRTKRGKITIGSFGNSRKARKAKRITVKPATSAQPVEETPKEAPKKRAPKKKEK